jgi:hypothetical protein
VQFGRARGVFAGLRCLGVMSRLYRYSAGEPDMFLYSERARAEFLEMVIR